MAKSDDDKPAEGIRFGEMPPVDFDSTGEAMDYLRPFEPVVLYRPHTVVYRVGQFQELFPGTLSYAVRANAEPRVLHDLAFCGVEWYTVASLAEAELMRGLLPDARLHCSAVVKAPEMIERAYERCRVRSFVVDHPREFNKIKANAGPDVSVLVRLAVPSPASLTEGERFGCSIDGAAHLMREIVNAGYKVGLAVNVGSQVLEPEAYEQSFAMMREVLYRAPYSLDMLSIGGGFPAPYKDYTPPDLKIYMNTIKRGVKSLRLPRTCRVLIEPGRALVADSLSLVTRVELRRGRYLYINDGLLGGLNGMVGGMKPTLRMIRMDDEVAGDIGEFTLAGPSGYINDLMPGPYELPADTNAGDYIEFGQLGAYALPMRTNFQSQPKPRLYSVGDSSTFILYENTDDENEEGYEEGYDDDILGVEPLPTEGRGRADEDR
jgi:ornithine decarboxylase